MVSKIQTLQTQVGLHDENLYTTAYDLSIIAKYAMNNDKFMEIVRKTKYTLPATDIHKSADRVLENSNLLLDPSQPNYYYAYATGLKTGFTDPAGDCLVASAKKDNVEFIAVCLHAGSLNNGLREKFLDCKTLFDFAFDNYTAHYKNLQEIRAKELENLNNKPSILETESSNEDTYTDFYRSVLKIFAVLIILFAMKRIFFGKKRKGKRRK